MRGAGHPSRAALLTVLCAGGALLCACSTKRVLTVRSAPPGARVWVNGVDRGTTPVEVPFVHYGRFEVRLEMAGHESLAGEVEVKSLVDGYPVIDLPYELAVRERRFEWTGRLVPILARPSESDARAALERAKALRARTSREIREEHAAPPPSPPKPPQVVR